MPDEPRTLSLPETDGFGTQGADFPAAGSAPTAELPDDAAPPEQGAPAPEGVGEAADTPAAPELEALVSADLPRGDVPRDGMGLATLAGAAADELEVPPLDLASAAAFVPSAPAADATTPARPRIRGTLIDLESRRPITFAQVMLMDAQGGVVAGGFSDPNGSFVITAPVAGEFYLNASALAYQQTTLGIDVEMGREHEVLFEIRPAPLPVAGLVVEREAGLAANGFLGRLQRGVGRFITPDDIDAARGQQLTDLLEMIPRVDVLREFGGARVVMQEGGSRCTPAVYLNGVAISAEGGEIDALAPLHAIQGVEVYQSSVQVPLQWAAHGPGGGCGAVVVWTQG